MKVSWLMYGGLSAETEHIVGYRCVEYPAIHKEIVTKFRNGMPLANTAVRSYYIDEPYDKTEYVTFEEALFKLKGFEPIYEDTTTLQDTEPQRVIIGYRRTGRQEYFPTLDAIMDELGKGGDETAQPG